MSTTSRYDRQLVLPEIGHEGQDKLSEASVLCIGAGGLGCPALIYLAASGVGRLGIVDFDRVDESNLQRQVLFTTEQIGENKADAAKNRLKLLNPDVKIETHAEELSDQNAVMLFENYDVIIDGTDNFSTKFLINDAAVKTGKPFIYGSILGFEGQVSTFNLNGGPCYRCLFPEAPKSHIPNCAEAGVIGAVAGIIGSVQAMEAIKIITKHESFETLSGKLWTIDMHTMQNRLLSLPKNPNCMVCSQDKKDITLQYSPRFCENIPEITAVQTQSNQQALLVDVRELDEWEAGHISGAQHFALSKLLQGQSPDLSHECEIILYCQKGVRSLHAAQILKQRGYQNLMNMAGGYESWLECA